MHIAPNKMASVRYLTPLLHFTAAPTNEGLSGDLTHVFHLVELRAPEHLAFWMHTTMAQCQVRLSLAGS